MKTRSTYVVLATALALVALVGLTLALAGGSASAGPDVASRILAPQALPAPYLNRPRVVDVPFDNPPTPVTDGYIAPGEYADADRISFPGYGGYYNEVEVFFVEDGTFLYVAFDVRALGPASNYADVYLDTDLDGDSSLDANDYLLRAEWDASTGVTQTLEYTPIGPSQWGTGGAPVNWTAAVTAGLAGGGWQAEFRIDFAKLGVTPGIFQELGVAVATTDGGLHFWPNGAIATGPNTWGSLVSSSDWGTFYWKPGPWEDYAPSGMPDFDQRQAQWSSGGISTHCGPVALANSLWWFDSKFETLTNTMPDTISDTYRLVTSYNPGVWDDHAITNVVPFVTDLASNYLGTNQGVSGTSVISMFYGIHQYLRVQGLWDDYIVTLVREPDFDWVADEVMRSEDVILLLGFYQDIEPDPEQEVWSRTGGHFVTVAGVDPAGMQIAFSDPIVDNAEAGMGPGRVNSGTLISHAPIPGHGPWVHNDAGNVSQDIYLVVPTSSPGGHWGPELYPWELFEPWFISPADMNPHPLIERGPYMGIAPEFPVQVEVEFAIAVSPYTWKSSGYWVENPVDPVQGTWQPWVDYAVNGVPDFDQKQDQWYHPLSLTWSYCGPAAAANSLWWFDSKFEPSPVGPNPPPPPLPGRRPLPPGPPPPPAPITTPHPLLPPPPNDNYPMVWSYDSIHPFPWWDDHDPANVETGVSAAPFLPLAIPILPNTAPLGVEFVDELAAYFDTDGQSSGVVHVGTVITDMYNGLNQYLLDRVNPMLPPAPPLRQGYVITQVQSPDFWWVAEEVEHSEDVILLIGFWQWQEVPPGSGEWEWVRLGGHYVTVPGVDKQGGLVAFSDPYYDGAGFAWPFAYPTGWPTVLGRVADGWLWQHQPAHVAHGHNDAGNLSHDVYYVAPTDSPGGIWGPKGYVEGWEGNFEAQNGGATGTYSDTYDLPQAEVEWAIAVSPVADVWVLKSFTAASVIPGDTVTFTLHFGNDGSLPAEDVVLTDTLPAGLINPTWAFYTSNGFAVTQQTGVTFTWDVPDLAWMEWGVITVTAQVDPNLAWPLQSTLYNTATIATSSLEQYQIPEIPDSSSANITVYGPDVGIAKTLVTSGTLTNGSWVTFTLSYSNTGQGTAYNVVITDALSAYLTSAGYSSSGATVNTTGSFSYTWQVADLTYGMGGVITITAQITAAFPHTDTIHNVASISALGDADLGNNQSGATIPVTGFTVHLPLVMRNY